MREEMTLSVLMRVWMMLAALLLAAAPAAAQFSDSYNFIKAVKDKDAAKVKELADKPGTTVVNARDGDTGEGALHIVTKRSDAAWVGYLLRFGANPDIKDREGNTPLILSAINRWSEGVRIFTLVKAQVNAQNRLGETALLKAVQNRDVNMVKQLLDAGANPDISDNSGTTARSFAAGDPRGEAVSKLFAEVAVKVPVRAQGPSL
jgi:ankyrin repeat protein